MDIVLSICLQSDIPAGYSGKSGASLAQLSGGPAPSLSDVSGSSKAHPILSGSSFKPTRDRQSGKRKDLDSMFSLPSLSLYSCYSMLI